MVEYEYIRDPAKIYEKSFAIVEEEARLDRLPADMRPIATRLVHSCGMIDVLDDLEFSSSAVKAGSESLNAGNPVFVDVEMVKAGIIGRFLPQENEIICTLNHTDVAGRAKEIENTRSAAAVDFWDERLGGAVVVIGNAPTALFRLLERLQEGAPPPALIIGLPVGFVGAVESKQVLATNSFGVEYITVHGRRGGSAMASGVLNGLAGGLG